MKIFRQKLKNVTRKVGSRLTLIVIIIVVFIVGYWLRGTLSPPTSRTEPAPTTKAAALDEVTLWTCSMHPHIKLPNPGRCPLCQMELIPLESGTKDMGGLRELTVSENAKKLMDIETVPVERKFVEAEVRMVGKIDYDETRLKYITAWIPGRLDRLYVDYTGVPVKKGDHMVYLYSPELLTAQEELLQALKAVKSIQESQLNIMQEMTAATVIAAREKLRLWGLTPEQIADIEKRGETTDHMTIYAPTGGIVIHKNAQEGMYVNTGTRIYTIADLTTVWVRLDAYEADLMWLRYGQEVELTTQAYPGERFIGTIAFIDPILTQETRTVKIRVNAANQEMRLKPGMFVRAVARAQVATAGRVMDTALAGKWMCPMHPDVVKDAADKCDICEMPLMRTESLGYVGIDPSNSDMPLVIPATAAMVTGTRAIVYVEIPDKEKPTFEGREIVLGPRAGDYYLVRHGLEEGERVVVKGNFKIDAELQIQAKPSMMTPEGGGGGGGHQHGGAAATKKEKAPGAMAMELPAVVKAQLHAVMAAAEDINKTVKAGELAKIRTAFSALEQKVLAVEQDRLTGHQAMLWKEYSMLLTNDGVEGKLIKNLSEAQQVSKMLGEHLRSMKSKFSLTHHQGAATVSTVSPEFRMQFDKVIADYLSLQKELAADKSKEAVAVAEKALNSLKSIDMKLLQGDDHMAWMKDSAELEKMLSRVAKTEDIEEVRKEFAMLSEQIASNVKRFGSSGQGSLYQFKCPMAFNNRGATWLQDDDKTRNPYFGTAMLKCGEVIQVLPRTEEKGGPHHD